MHDSSAQARLAPINSSHAAQYITACLPRSSLPCQLRACTYNMTTGVRYHRSAGSARTVLVSQSSTNSEYGGRIGSAGGLRAGRQCRSATRASAWDLEPNRQKSIGVALAEPMEAD